jgi:hypothetical protein
MAGRSEPCGLFRELTLNFSDLVWGPTGIDHVANSLVDESVPETCASCDQATPGSLEIPSAVSSRLVVEGECETGSATAEDSTTDVKRMYCSADELVGCEITVSANVGADGNAFLFWTETGARINWVLVPGAG